MTNKLLFASAALMGFLVALTAAYYVGRADGRVAGDAAVATVRESLAQQHADNLNSVLDAERSARASQIAALEKTAKEKTHVLETRDRQLADLRAERVRWSVPVRSSASAPEAAGADPGREAEARAELSESARQFFADFAAEANRNTIELNACIEGRERDRQMNQEKTP